MTALRKRAIVATGIASLLLADSSRAACPSGNTEIDTRIDSYFNKAVRGKLPGLVEAALRNTPRFSAAARQDATPSAAGSLGTIVDEAGFTSLLSAAFDQTLGSDGEDDNEGLTVNLSPFTMAVAYDAGVYYDQKRYERVEYEVMRRIAGALSFGGKGERFDRDGDGNPDEALGAKALDDIVTWELRVRLFGSHDRRRPSNYNYIFSRLESGSVDLDSLTRAVTPFVTDRRLDAYTDRSRCISDAQWGELNQEAWFKEAIAVPTEALIKANSNYEKAVTEVDSGLLVTAAFTGVQRGREFGEDKIGTSLRASWRQATLNFDWMRMESMVPGRSDVNEYKIAGQLEQKILKDLVGEQGLDVSIGGVVEIFENDPNVKHDTTVKLQAKFEIPLFEGASIPLSLTWANHEDLISKDDEVIGRLGINFDTSRLLELARGK